MKKLIVLFVILIFYSEVAYSCHCNTIPNNPTQNVVGNSITLGATKSYPTHCNSDYNLIVEVVPVASSFSNVATHVGPTVSNPGFGPLPSIQISFNELAPGDYKWQFSQRESSEGGCEIDNRWGEAPTTFTVPARIPVLSEWGLIIILLLILVFSVVSINMQRVYIFQDNS